ncbi:MAG: SRPBCC family protein [Ornithinimicrobium sp.]|uniref:SRPBCC family protein n=1 Tax=Ornithinimicrobium sp. TaxID=1977084 RepID=UPI003D9B125E
MAGHAVTVQRTIQAPVQRVWDVLTDLDRAAQRRSAITEVEILTDGPYALGTTWLQTRRMLGRSATEEMCVTDNDPLRRTVIEASSSGADYTTTFVLTEAVDSVTELSVELRAETADPTTPQKVAWAVVGKAGRTATERALRADLDDIAAAATAPG